MKNGFVSFDSITGKVYGLAEKSMQANKRVGGVGSVPTMVVLSAIPVTFRTSVSRAELVSIRQDYEDYCGKGAAPSEPEPVCGRERVDSDEFFDKDLLWYKVGMQRTTRRRRCWQHVHWFQPCLMRCPCPRGIREASAVSFQ